MESEGHRTATWLELFYDLAFVVVVAVISERLFENPTVGGVFSYLGFFGLIWWLWASHTFYADRFDTDDLVYRLLAAGQMAAVAVMAASLTPHSPTESAAFFAAAYATHRVIQWVMYWRVYRHVTETRVLANGYLVGFGLAATVWIASAFVDGSARYVMWAVAMSIDLATPWVMRREQAKVPLDVSHFPERFGLFTILVLGESIAAVALGLSHHEWAPAPIVTATMGVGLATALWWLYFENVSGTVVRRNRATRRTWRPTVWIYTHMPLVAGLGAVGVGLDLAVSEAGDHAMPDDARWLLLGAVAVALLAMAVIQLATMASTPTTRQRGIVMSRLSAIPFLLIVGLLGSLGPQWVVAGALGITIAVVVADLSLARQETG